MHNNLHPRKSYTFLVCTSTKSSISICVASEKKPRERKCNLEGPRGLTLVNSPAAISPLVLLFLQPNTPKGMNFTQKKIIPVLVLILSSLSIIRLVKITIATTSPSLFSGLPPTLRHKCSSPSCISLDSTNLPKTSLLKKEYIHLFNLVASKVQCNLLIFGLKPEYIALSEINAGGTTIILEDDQEKLSTIRTNSSKSRIYKVEYQIPAKDAYKLLKHARKNPGCAPISELHLAKCRLALTTLPQEVYELKWDVVVVDGPKGDTPDSPGRMGAIYSAAVLARAGNGTDVAVHDVDRTIEKWFSWEFLCDKNLVSSRGKLWIFRIKDQQNATTFCSATMPE